MLYSSNIPIISLRARSLCVCKYLFPLGIVWFSTATTTSTVDLSSSQTEQGLHGGQTGVGVVEVILQLGGQLLLADLLGEEDSTESLSWK